MVCQPRSGVGVQHEDEAEGELRRARRGGKWPAGVHPARHLLSFSLQVVLVPHEEALIDLGRNFGGVLSPPAEDGSTWTYVCDLLVRLFYDTLRQLRHKARP